MMAEVKMKYLKLGMSSTLYHELNGYCVLRKRDFIELIRDAISLWLLLAQADDIEIIADGKSLKLDF